MDLNKRRYQLECIAGKSEVRLKDGSVVTVEPGDCILYMAGGVRALMKEGAIVGYLEGGPRGQ